MTTYASNELIPSSEFAKRFGTYLSQVTGNMIDKLAILKNNRVEAVLVSKEEYERMQAALEYMENMEIAQTIRTRTSRPYRTLSEAEMLDELGIAEDELS